MLLHLKLTFRENITNTKDDPTLLQIQAELMEGRSDALEGAIVKANPMRAPAVTP